ncbi:PepSY domain-containing protein [Olivibacter sp. SDN3]|uniref:PepSY-associated TM helix domain-containing protein n=1 Tax=Olivibacter sp. SDN3 TaxID=2764720 RepID=UPI001650E39F|nr:PepSY-associated TM helix domain-containing protein [Olivibacter sp. SDN3]QNL52024.1 PepSY domain-containing protein [Olivibacter sp. SDN3]
MAGGTGKKDKKLLWKLHHWAGLYTGVLIGILSLTGALAVFIPEIDALIIKYYHQAKVENNLAELKLNVAIDSLKRAHADYRSMMIALPEKEGQVLQVDLIRPGKGGEGFERYDFFIDTGTGKLIGKRDHQNSLANYMRQMHVRLYEGNWGRQLVGIGGIALAVLVITGLLIYGDFMKKQQWPKLRKTGKLRIMMADWHKLLGISALAFNLVIALTGAWLGLQPWLMRWLNIGIPNAFKQEVVMEAADDKALDVDWNKALAVTKETFPELEPRYLVPSTNGAGTIGIRGNIRGTVYERESNLLVLDKVHYRPVFKYDIRKQTVGAKFYFIQEALHFGDFGGLLLKFVYALLGLVSAFLSISGFVIYYYRTERKKGRRTTALKMTFLWSAVILLLLILIALISLFVGYTQAATVAAVIINTLLVGLLLYALVDFLRKRYLQ